MTAPLTVIDHPLLQHKLSMARSADTTTDNFRRLVREIAAVHGGTLTLESTLGEGTTARIAIGNQTVTCR